MFQGRSQDLGPTVASTPRQCHRYCSLAQSVRPDQPGERGRGGRGLGASVKLDRGGLWCSPSEELSILPLLELAGSTLSIFLDVMCPSLHHNGSLPWKGPTLRFLEGALLVWAHPLHLLRHLVVKSENAPPTRQGEISETSVPV